MIANHVLRIKKIYYIRGAADAPTSCLDFGLSHENQIELITKAQDRILKLQADQIIFKNEKCPECKDGILKKHGFKESWFYSVFIDHRVKISRRRCNKCHHVDSETLTSLVG